MRVRLLSAFAFFVVIATLTACETEEDIQLSGAQTCIDAARTEAEADVCYAKVSGLSSEKSYLIRCSANFIAQGFTGTRFATAFQRLKDNPTSGQDPMATIMAYLVFSKTSATHTADNAVTNCNRSGVRSMQRLATMAQLATFVASTAGIAGALDPLSASFNPAQISAAITTLANSGSASDQAAVGAIAVQANTAYCNEGSTFKTNEVCKNLSTAIAAGSSSQVIGQQLLAALQGIN